MAKRPARKLVRKGFAKLLVGTPHCGVRTAQRAVPTFEIQVCCSRVIFGALRFCIELNHPLFIQRSFQATQCSNRIRAHGRSEQEDRLILWKEVKIVFERDQIILLDLCVCRVGVLNVNRSIGERAVTQRVIDADDILLWKRIPLAQWSPAILPI